VENSVYVGENIRSIGGAPFLRGGNSLQAGLVHCGWAGLGRCRPGLHCFFTNWRVSGTLAEINKGTTVVSENTEHLVWALRSIAAHFGVEIDQQRLRHLAVEIESQSGASDSLAENLGPIARHFGFRISQLQASLKEVHSLLDERLPLVLFRMVDGRPAPLVLLGRRGRRYLVDGYLHGKPRWLSADRISSELVDLSRDPELRIGIQVSQQVAEIGKPSMVGEFPLIWLWNFLKSERPDFRVLLLFASCISLLALATPITVEALVNTVAFGRYVQPVLVLSLILFVLLSFRAALIATSTWIVEIIQRRLFVRVVSDLTFRLPRLDQRAYDNNYIPEMVNRFFDVMNIQKAVSVFLIDGITVSLQVVIGMAVLAFYHPLLLGFDVVLLFFITVYLYFIGRGAVSTSITESKYKYKTAAWLEEIGRSPNAFRRNAGVNLAEHRADEFAQSYITARSAHFRILMRQIVSTLGIQTLAATALLALGGWLVIQGGLTLGQLVAAELIVTGILGSVAKMGKHIEIYYDTMASSDKLRQLLELPVTVDGYYPPVDFSRLGQVQIENVTYSYGGKSICYPKFTVEQGETIAVVGAAGSGKSTLLQLLAGLRLPSSGIIQMAGVCSHELNFSLVEREIGYSAGNEVIRGTIAENVHLDRANVRSVDVRKALELVGLLAEVESLPQGIDTELECLGQPLSESQCLRLMLARAIVERPKLLLVDGTLDKLADRELPQLIENLLGKSTPWTTVISTGRNQIIVACDHFLDLDRGELKNPKLEMR
jgi:putative ABC transport system ATP-binding protein